MPNPVTGCRSRWARDGSTDDLLIASTNMYTLEPAPPLRCLHSGNLISNIPRPRRLFVRSYITLTMGKDGGVNGTAGIKTKFDGLSRNSGYCIYGVFVALTNGNWAWLNGPSRVVWGDADGTSSGSDQGVLSTTIHVMEYAYDGIVDVTSYFRFRMNCSWPLTPSLSLFSSLLFLGVVIFCGLWSSCVKVG